MLNKYIIKNLLFIILEEEFKPNKFTSNKSTFNKKKKGKGLVILEKKFNSNKSNFNKIEKKKGKIKKKEKERKR